MYDVDEIDRALYTMDRTAEKAGAGSTGIRVRLRIKVEADGGDFHAWCPDLPGLHTSGGSVEEARHNAQEAALAYLSSLLKHDDPFPVGVLVEKPERSVIDFLADKLRTRIRSGETNSFVEEIRVPLRLAA